MRPMFISRAMLLEGAISPKARQVWAKLWEMPPPNLVNLKTTAELMTEPELEENFELWQRVINEDLDDLRRKKIFPDLKMRSTRRQVRDHVLEMVVLINEILRRYRGGLLHVEAGIISGIGSGDDDPNQDSDT